MRTAIVSALAAVGFLGSGAGRAQAQTQQTPPATPLVDAPHPAGVPSPQGPAGKAQGGAAPVDKKSYIIGPEDVLRVLIWQQGNLPGEHIVRPDGMISVPLAGEVKADGMTPEQLEQEIANRLKESKQILNPSVTVQVWAVHSKKFFISGEVNKPGPYDLVVPTKVSEALTQAGGFRDFAKTKKIRIVRKDGSVHYYNDKDVSHGKHTDQDILLEPGDHIYID